MGGLLNWGWANELELI